MSARPVRKAPRAPCWPGPGSALSVDSPERLGQLVHSSELLPPARGHPGLSFSWLLLELGLLVWCHRSGGLEVSHPCCALPLLEDQEPAALLGVRASDLPTWVHFPDTESVAWVNKMVKNACPFICHFVEKLFPKTTEPAVWGAKALFSTFTVMKENVGSSPLDSENVDKR